MEGCTVGQGEVVVGKLPTLACVAMVHGGKGKWQAARSFAICRINASPIVVVES